MCKNGLINVVFVIDESGSMSGTENDVIGGFKSVVDEQKENKNGSCTVSYYKFASGVEEVYKGEDVNNVEYLDGKYRPNGLTALFDGIGTAIDNIGKWLDGMKEEDKPEKTIVVIMTDGGENNSKDYSAGKVKEMIKHQEDKYNWTFVYMGSDLTDASDANSLGITTRCFASSSNYMSNYSIVNEAISCYRDDIDCDIKTKSLNLKARLKKSCDDATEKYASENNIDVNKLKSNE